VDFAEQGVDLATIAVTTGDTTGHPQSREWVSAPKTAEEWRLDPVPAIAKTLTAPTHQP